MRNITFLDSFIPKSCYGNPSRWDKGGTPAVILEAGLTWMDVYAAASLDRELVRKILFYDLAETFNEWSFGGW